MTPDANLVVAEYVATLNPAGATPALLDGDPAAKVTSGPVHLAPGADVDVVIEGPPGEPTGVTGPFIITFSTSVTNVTIQNTIVMLAGGDTPVPGTLVCKNGAGTVVDCVAGPVVTVQFFPTDPLITGGSYIVIINQLGSTPVLIDGLPVPIVISDPTEVTTVVSELSPAITYRWCRNAHPLAFGHRYAVEDGAGATATFAFSGKRIQWLTITGKAYGRATVRIDGTIVDQVNNYSAKTRFGVPRNYGGLTAGDHELMITVLGKPGRHSSKGKGVAIDAFKVWSGGGVQLDQNPTPVYGLAPRTLAAASDGTYVTSGRVKSALVMAFVGTGIEWHTLVGDGQGRAIVVIDGHRVALVDNGKPAGTLTPKTRTYQGLTDGLHVLRIAVYKHLKGKGRSVAVDGFVVQ